MSTMTRASIHFNKEDHVYRVGDTDLPGITRRIGLRLGKVFPACLAEVPRVSEAAEFGSSIHESVERFVKTGELPEHPVSRWILKQWSELFPSHEYLWASEMLVSDYQTGATAIDLAALKGSDAHIADIKTGNFDREYCSWQLGIGKYLLEKDGDLIVTSCFVISSKDKFVYEITPKSRKRVEDLLYG